MRRPPRLATPRLGAWRPSVDVEEPLRLLLDAVNRLVALGLGFEEVGQRLLGDVALLFQGKGVLLGRLELVLGSLVLTEGSFLDLALRIHLLAGLVSFGDQALVVRIRLLLLFGLLL